MGEEHESQDRQEAMMAVERGVEDRGMKVGVATEKEQGKQMDEGWL